MSHCQQCNFWSYGWETPRVPSHEKSTGNERFRTRLPPLEIWAPNSKNPKSYICLNKKCGKRFGTYFHFFNFGPIFDGSSWSMGVGYPPEGSQTREKYRKWTFQNVVPPSPNMSVQLQKTKKLERFEKKLRIFASNFTGSWLELHLGNQLYFLNCMQKIIA